MAAAQLAAGADQEVGVGKAGGVKIVGDHLLVHAQIGELAVGGGGGDAVEERVEGVDQLGAGAVIERHDQLHARVFRGDGDAVLDVFLHLFGKLAGAADDQQADVVVVDDGQLLAQVFAQEAHQEIHFGFGAAPVFDGKGVKSEG